MNFDPSFCTTLNIPGFDHSLRLQTHGPGELVSEFVLKDKLWEAYETQLLLKNLKAGQTLLDIGANIGYYSLVASKILGEDGKIIAIEPESSNFELLAHNIENNQLSNVEAFNVGLGQTTESIDFFTSPQNRGDHRAFDFDGDREKTSIKIINGDELVKDQPINFIKIDTQGFEYEIIRGLKHTISKNRQGLKMILEFWPFALRQNGASADSLLDEIEAYDFTIHVIDHIQHQLKPTSVPKLRELCRNELTEGKQGFINLWLS